MNVMFFNQKGEKSKKMNFMELYRMGRTRMHIELEQPSCPSCFSGEIIHSSGEVVL